MAEYVLKKDDRYLAPTYLSKFSWVTIGDLVPEQVYAARYRERNVAVSIAVNLNWAGEVYQPDWRVIRLRPRTTSARSGASKEEPTTSPSSERLK